jgi:hypothetical protein
MVFAFYNRMFQFLSRRLYLAVVEPEDIGQLEWIVGYKAGDIGYKYYTWLLWNQRI